MNQDYILVYEGSLVYSNRIANELISKKINPIIKSTSESARLAGFGIVNEQIIRIFVHLDELVLSKRIIKNLEI